MHVTAGHFQQPLIQLLKRDMVNKSKVVEQLHLALEETYQVAFNAAQRAHETATADENIAENKYDTLAVEAAYLAQGQSVRVEQCDADIQAFKTLPPNGGTDRITLGSLVVLVDDNDIEKYLFFGPSAGGLKIVVDGIEVVVVTQASPLGKIAYGKEHGEEFSLTIAGKIYDYEVSAIF